MGIGGDPGGGMAHFQRLIWFLCGVLLAAVPMLAMAAEEYRTNQTDATIGATALESCQRWASFSGYHGPFLAGQWTPGPQGSTTWVGTGLVCGSTEYPGVYFPIAVRGLEGCETGERVAATGECFQCPEGRTWNPNLQTCESKCQALGGNSAGTSSDWVTVDLDRIPTGNPTFCTDGCLATGQKVECTTASSNVSGDYVQVGQLCSIQGPFTYTGGGCEGNIPNIIGVEPDENRWWDTGKDEKECVASGGMPGQVNGQQVCVRKQDGETWDTKTDSTSTPTQTTTTNPDGTTTTTKTTTITSTSGGTGTTKTTETTTVRDADGNIISETTTETIQDEPKTDFCAKNPTDPACVGEVAGGSFEGNCSSGFECSGDAVMCAVAKAQHESNCATAVSDEVLGQFAAIQQYGGTAPGEGLDRQQIDVPTALSVAEIGGGSGLQDQSFTVMGKTIDIPFSKLNLYITMLGYAVMMVAWIGAWRIITGAF